MRVPKLFDVESFATVHHLVSTVTGELAPGRDAIDLLRGAFPGGSITGAPKLRAMEIIEELEPHRRGVYCGAIGYIGFDGGMDLNIAIRTLVMSRGEIRFWAGGGIVADSRLEDEYQETFDKAAAMLKLLQQAFDLAGARLMRMRCESSRSRSSRPAARGAFAQQAKDVDVLWVGPTGSPRRKRWKIRPRRRATATSRRASSPSHQTQRVPAAIGTRFGIAYVLKGEPEGAVVPVQAYWRFPAQGITNPETRTTTFEWKTPELQCRVEQKPFCLMGYPLQHPWELVPGKWTIEIWVEGAKRVEASFDLYVP